MARPAKLIISVSSTRNSSTVSYTTQGVYRSFTVNNVRDTVQPAPVFTTSGSKAFWEAVMDLVRADIVAGNGGGT
jgi:hypothetical protein